eukprot:5022073-Amphidinium_carterae.1
MLSATPSWQPRRISAVVHAAVTVKEPPKYACEGLSGELVVLVLVVVLIVLSVPIITEVLLVKLVLLEL